MNFAILRTAKLKTTQNIAGSAHHCFRSRDTPNADPSRLALNKVQGAASADEVCQAVKKRLEGLKVRKNAVHCVEYMITVSPEVYKRDPRLVAAYLEDARKWLIDTHGAENVVSVSFHYDEKPPHLSAYVVPVDPKGKLNASHFFDGRQKCSDFQTRFWEAVGKPHGLDRGIEGSTAKHTTLKEYYANIQRESPETFLKPDEVAPRVVKKGWIKDTKETPEQVAKRLTATVEKRSRPLKAKVKQAELDKASHQARAADLARLRAESARLREVPLEQVFEALGATRDPDDRKNWRIGSSRISVEGSKWYDHANSVGGGGAIDLVKHVEETDYKGALQWLGQAFGASAAASHVLHQTHIHAKRAIAEPPKPFEPPAPVPAHWSTVRDYITKTRCIAERIVDALHDKGLIFADKFRNAVFLLGQAEGVELRGTTDKPYHRTKGKKALFEVRFGEAKTAAFVEAPIDALSFGELMKFKGRVISVGGNNEKRMLERADQLRGEGYELVAAFDADPTGDRLTALLNAPRLTPPNGCKDWNQALVEAKKRPVGGAPTGADLIAQIRAAATTSTPSASAPKPRAP